MEIKFEDIENAFEFVSSGLQFESSAIIDKTTGEIYYTSEMSGIDEIPEGIELESDRYVSIPHKNDLNLGRNLVFQFSALFLQDEIDEIDSIFRRKGAYRRYKDLLESKGLLEKWYSFENEHQKSALLEWCEENDIQISA
jgi:hypothetical protein